MTCSNPLLSFYRRNTSLVYCSMGSLALSVFLVWSRALRLCCFLCEFRPCSQQRSQLFWRLHTEKKFKEPRPVFLVCEEISFWVLTPSWNILLIFSNKKSFFMRLSSKGFSNLFIKVLNEKSRTMAPYPPHSGLHHPLVKPSTTWTPNYLAYLVPPNT